MATDEINFYAEKDYKVGEILMKEAPLVSVIKTSHLSIVCSNCFEASFLKCSSCKMVTYCSRNCQKIDFKAGHKMECKGLQKVFPNKPTWMMRLLARVLYKINKDPELYLVASETTNRADREGLKRLQSHRNRFPIEKIQKFAELAMGMQLFLEREYIFEPAVMIDLLCLISCNSLSVTDAEQETVGACISLKLSAINHSCLPNASVVFSSSEAVLMAIQDIKKGEEVCIAYIDHTQPTVDRKLELKQNYLFGCDCLMCEQNICVQPSLKEFTATWNDLLAKMDWRGAVDVGIDYCEKLEKVFGTFYPRVAILQYQIFRCAKLILDYQVSLKYGLLAVKNMPQCLNLSKNLREEYSDWRRSIGM
jgi:hypothetical protein